MRDTLKFCRGQIWLWNDPIYGAKGDGKAVADLEGVTRFSRYVLVVQSNSEDQSIILCCPCSTSNRDEGNIPIGLALTTGGCDTKIMPRKIFPVDPASLTKYIATVSEQVMAEVNAELVRYILPDLMSVFSPEDISTWSFIDMDWRYSINPSDYRFKPDEPTASVNHDSSTTKSDQINTAEQTTPILPTKVQDINDDDPFRDIDIRYAPAAISKLANMIREYTRQVMGLYYNDSEYKTIGSCAYYSLLYFMGIDSNAVDDLEHIDDDYMRNNQLYNSFHFIDKLYNDREISNICVLDELIFQYLDKYGDILDKANEKYKEEYKCIHPEWLEAFERRVIPRLGGPSSNNKRMIDAVKKLIVQ